MGLERGDTVDRYVVHDRLGAGGMGEVYRAFDPRLQRHVALKVLRPAEDEDPKSAAERSARVLLEARAAALLAHPNVVAVYDAGEAAAPERLRGTPYITMELIVGRSLRDHIGASDVSLATRVSWLIDVARALGAAHARGLVHRDVKPSNVMVREDGAVKVLDFGIAKRTGRALDPVGPTQQEGVGLLTAAGFLVGTPAYMAPEQLRGEAVDGRVDQFAWGVTAYELLCGRLPWLSTDAVQLVAEILGRDPVALSTIDPSIPPNVSAAVMRALTKVPGFRFETMADLVSALADENFAPEPHAAALPGSVNTPAAARSDRSRSSIAVLPFLDLSARRDQDYLCEGIAEEILTALTHVSGLRVAARSSSFHLESRDSRVAGTRLGVATVLEGAVRREGDRLRVTVQLVETADGYQRWSQRFDGSAADVFAIQDEIAAAVTRQLRGVLSSSVENVMKRPETTPEAYEHFLRGRKLLREHGTRALQGAARELERAIEIDPRYAPAYAALAQVKGMLVEWHRGGPEVAEAASFASRKAVELGEGLAEAHVARGAVLAMRREFAEAAAAFEQAIAKNPQSFEAHYEYARLLFKMGDAERAVVQFQKAAEVQPDDFQCLLLVAAPLHSLGRAAEAEASAREGLRRAERALLVDPENGRALVLGASGWADLGDRERALDWCRRAEAAMPDDDAIGYNAACVYSVLGEHDAALSRLEHVIRGGRFGQRVWLERDTTLDCLRADPRFQALLDKLP